MAAISTTKKHAVVKGKRVLQWYGTSATNSADTLTTDTVPEGDAWRLTGVTLVYDGSATYTGTALTVQIDSGINAIYDTTLASGTDNTQVFTYFPTGTVWLLKGDAIVVAAPAGGAGREASITVTLEA